MECGIVVNFSVRNNLLSFKIGMARMPELDNSFGALGMFVVSEVEGAGELAATFGCVSCGVHALDSFIHGSGGMCL